MSKHAEKIRRRIERLKAAIEAGEHKDVGELEAEIIDLQADEEGLRDLDNDDE